MFHLTLIKSTKSNLGLVIGLGGLRLGKTQLTLMIKGVMWPFCPTRLLSEGLHSPGVIYGRSSLCGLSRTHSEVAMLNFTARAPLHIILKQTNEQMYLGSQLK